MAIVGYVNTLGMRSQRKSVYITIAKRTTSTAFSAARRPSMLVALPDVV